MSEPRKVKVGWLGTGRMGFELALRLINAGYDVRVWNRTREKAEPLASLGAAIVDRPVDLADRDVVFSIVSSSDVFTRVMIGDGGLLSGDLAPPLLVDSSTISAAASDRIRTEATKHGTDLLAAPVSGSPKVIRSGRLSVVVSGEHDAFLRAAPLLEVFGKSVTYVGEGDRARLVKICHNLLLGVMTQVLAETTVLAERAGIARADYLDFINNSVMGSVFSQYKTPGLVELDYTPTFTGHLLRKDFELGLDAARELHVPLPVSALVHQKVIDMIGQGLGDVDFSALLEMAARGSDLKLVAEDASQVTDGLTPALDDLSAKRPA